MTNKNGERTDCFAFIKGRYGKNSCNALVDWYNANNDKKRCIKCPFFKKRDQVIQEREKSLYRLGELRRG